MITPIDRDIGRLVDLVHERGLDRRTLVMFISDNGPHKDQPLELYNLARGPREEHNVAAGEPAVVRRAETYLKTAGTDSPDWPVK